MIAAGRRRSKTFGATSARSRGPSLRLRLALALVPALFALAHLTFGANQLPAALWWTAILGLALTIALATSLRRDLHDVSGLAVPAGLFALVLAAALWSLTPWGPGGPHPIWAWAGVAPRALTLDLSATLIEIVKLVGLAAAFGLGVLQGVRRDRARATLEVVVWIGGVYALVSLLTFLAGVQIFQGGRLSGGFMSANSGGTVFGLLTVLGLALLLQAWRKQSALGLSRRLTAVAVPLACVILSIVCLLLTASRMGLVATLVATSLLLGWELAKASQGRGVISLVVAVMVIIAGVLVSSGNDLVWMRVEGLDADVEIRGEIFQSHWTAFLASPLFGSGLGGFDATNLQIMTAETAYELWSIRAVHNVYLQWLGEAGLVGAVPMFALIAWVTAVALFRSGDGRSRTLQHGLVCANLVVLIHGLTDYALQVPSIAAFWAFLLGLQFAFGQGRSG